MFDIFNKFIYQAWDSDMFNSSVENMTYCFAAIISIAAIAL